MARRRDLRQYTIPGINEPPAEPYPSVTSALSVIAKPALVGWSAKVEREAAIFAAMELLTRPGPRLTRESFFALFETEIRTAKAVQKIQQEALEIGTRLHALVEADLKAELGIGPTVHVNERHPSAVETSFLHWLDWRQQHHVKPLVMERVVYSQTHRYAGTMDLVAEVDSARSVIDLKTSRAIYPEMALQVTAYRHAWAEMGHATDQGLVLRLPKAVSDPGFEAVPVTDPALFDVFLTALRLFHWWKDTA